MPLPLLPLAIKGLIVLGKAIAAKGMAAKFGYVLLKTISAYGLSATVGGVLTVGIVVGGVVWAKERVDNLRLAFVALENENVGAAITHFAKLAISIGGTVDALPHAVHDYLVTIKTGEEKAQAVAEVIKGLRNDIATEIARLS
jgi:hypothetical protein